MTATVAVRLGRLQANNSGHFAQQVNLTNLSSAPIGGPIFLALDSLTAGATVVGASGFTVCGTPTGSPYVSVSPTGIADRRGQGNASIEFQLEFVSPNGPAISFTPRVLAGAGSQ